MVARYRSLFFLYISFICFFSSLAAKSLYMIVPLGHCDTTHGNGYTHYYIDKRLQETYDELVLNKLESSASDIIAQNHFKPYVVSCLSYWVNYVIHKPKKTILKKLSGGMHGSFSFSCLCSYRRYGNIVSKYIDTPLSALITQYNKDLKHCAKTFASKTLDETLFVRCTAYNESNKSFDNLQVHIMVPQVMETFHAGIDTIIEKIKQDYTQTQ